MSPTIIAIIMFGAMLLLFITGRQIVLLLGGIAIIVAATLWGTSGGVDMGYFATFSFLGWYVLIACPMFAFMGYVLAKSGVGDAMYDAIYKWSGPIRGGLAMGTIAICTLIAAMVGIATTGTIATGVVAVPSMLKRKYDKLMITGAVQAGGALGILIPPSLVFIVYGLIARTSIGHLWLAGVFPGLLLATMFIIYIGVRCYFQPHLGPPLPPEERASWGEKLTSLRSAVLPVALIFLVLGLFFLGVTTLIESSAVGAVGSLICAAVNRRLTWKLFIEALDDTLKITSVVLWVVAAALLFSAVFDGLGAIHAVESVLKGVDNKWVALIAMMLTWIILGTIMDDTAMLIIVAPLFIPLARYYGIDLIWFGVLYVVNCQMAYLTPPFGYNLFVMKAIAPPEIRIQDIYRSVIPFVLLQCTGLVLLIIFPQIALWLPFTVLGKPG